MPKDDLILQTKLIAPQIKGKILRRERLLNLLRENLDKKLTLICADAGYGKTTLLTDFIQRIKKPYIWYSLNSDDRFFITFMRHLIVGIRKYLPEFGDNILTRFSKYILLSNVDEILTTFTNNLQAVPHIDFWIILDDYHTIADSKEINDCVNFLLSHSPSNLHFIITTRSKPSFSIPLLKAKGNCYTLSVEDLKFTHEETLMLYHDIWKLNYNEEEISKLRSKTGGWITALYLFMTFLKEKREFDLTIFPTEVCEDLYKYLAEEIFLSQSKTIQDFLIKTSLLNTLQARICDELLGIKNSQQILRQLEDSGLFTHCIDNEQGVYQYHPLFREFLITNLKRTLSYKEYSQLHSKAGRIFAKFGDYFDALDHFIKISKWRKAANLLYKLIKDEIQRAKILQIENYLHKFPIDYPEKDIRLLLVKGLIAYYRERYQDAFSLFKQVEKNLKEKSKKRELLKVLTIEANCHSRFGNCSEALSLSEEALRLQPKGEEKADVLCFAKGPSLLRLNKKEEAGTCFSNAYEIYTKTGNLGGKSKAMVHLGAVHYAMGDLISTTHYLEAARDNLEKLNDNFNLGIALINLAVTYNILREDEKAGEVIEQAIDLGKKFGIKEVIGEALCALAKLKCNKGDEEGFRLFEQSIKIFEEIGDNYDTTGTLLSYADAKRLSGYLPGAMRLVDKAKEHIDTFNLDIIIPSYKITRGIIECELGYYSKAKDELNGILKMLKSNPNKYDIFLSYLYLARLYYLLKDKDSLLEVLEKCINGARENHYEMTFVTERNISSPLLTYYFAFHPDDIYIMSILEKLGRSTTEYLLPLIDKKNIALSKSVIELLSRIRDPNSISKLKTYTKHVELNDVADFAIKCISEIGVKNLSVHFFDKMVVYRNDEMIKDWKYKAVRNLLQLLVINKGRRLPRDEIIETLWPGMPLNKGLANLYNALSSLRKILETGKHSKISIIRLESEYCWLEWNEDYFYDVDQFLEYYRLGKVKEREDISECLNAYEKAIQIYSGDFLNEERYLDWIEQERKRLREIFISILSQIASIYIQRQAYNRAIEYHHEILKLDPCIEKSHRELMLCYWKLNDKKRAIEQYKDCAKVFKQQLGLEPAIETKRLFEIILSHF